MDLRVRGDDGLREMLTFEQPYFKIQNLKSKMVYNNYVWRDARVVEWGGLENRCGSYGSP